MAEHLHVTIPVVREMSTDEFDGWLAYFEWKRDIEKKEESKRNLKNNNKVTKL